MTTRRAIRVPPGERVRAETEINTPIPDEEFQAFAQWLRDNAPSARVHPNVGAGSAFFPDVVGIRNDTTYLAWVDAGRPGFTGLAAGTPEATTAFIQGLTRNPDGSFNLTDVQGNPDAMRALLDAGFTVETEGEFGALPIGQQRLTPPTQPTPEDLPISPEVQAALEAEARQVEADEAFRQSQLAQQERTSLRQFELGERGLEIEAQRLQFQRMQPQESFQDFQNRLLSTLEEPVDWIRRWNVQHLPPPPQIDIPLTATQQADVSEALETGIREQNLRLASQIRGTPQTPFGEAGLMPELSPEQRISAQTELSNLEQALRDVGEPSVPVPQAEIGAPPTPEFLANLVPELTAGQPLTQIGRIRTPSAQQFGRLRPSELQGLRGFVESPFFEGPRTFEDILDQIARTLPETPRGARGARVTPARQRGGGF